MKFISRPNVLKSIWARKQTPLKIKFKKPKLLLRMRKSMKTVENIKILNTHCILDCLVTWSSTSGTVEARRPSWRITLLLRGTISSGMWRLCWQLSFQQPQTFHLQVLIYVFDVESRELEKDLHYYQSCLEAILQNSPEVN